MDNDLRRAADSFLSGEDGKKIADKRSEIERLASSSDGESVKAMLDSAGFEDAVRRGDTNALRDALSGIIKTDSGARLVKNLQELMSRE